MAIADTVCQELFEETWNKFRTPWTMEVKPSGVWHRTIWLLHNKLSTFLRNICVHLPKYTASRTTQQYRRSYRHGLTLKSLN